MDKKTFYPDNSIYFLTGSTFLHYPYFKTEEQKQLLKDKFKKTIERLGIRILAYSIAINHYHLLLYVDKGIKLGSVKQYLHGGTTFEYKKIWPMRYKEFWHSSNILLIYSDESYWKITGYIISNLLKHKEETKFKGLKENLYSSYRFIAGKYGDEFAENLVRSVISIGEDSDGSINIEQFKSAKALKPSAKAE
jgi:REP element-mobilizing transposase RayT